MHATQGLEQIVAHLVVILSASVAVLFVSHKVRLSPVVGLVLTGMLIGPSALGLIDRGSVELYAELGVVLLLFTVGLEVSLVRLRRNWRAFLLGGGAQVTLTVAAAAGLATAFGLPLPQGVFLGFLAALSSTAIVLKMYTDRQELPTPQGTVSASILLFQDFCLAPMIFLVPVLAGDAASSGGEIASRVGLGLLTVAAAFVIARTVMPRILEWIVGTRTREVFVLGALAICLAMALITSHLGFSLALGAFLAGLIISESQYSHQVIAEVLPLRDVFNSLFFIAVGMLLDFGEVGRNAALVIGLGGAVLVGKAAIAALVTGWLGYASRVALIVGVSIAQIGEFSLVLAGVGRDLDLLPGPLFQVFLGAAILTMLVTPFLIALAPRLADRAPSVRIPASLRRARLDPVAAPDEEGAREKHVVIVGYGLNGSNLSRVLASTGIPFVVLELNGAAVRDGARRGHPVVFGDATRVEILAAHGLERARMLVVGIADQAATRRIVRNARTLNPAIHILVRTLEVGQVDELRSLGADDVIPEEFETSVEIFSRVLEHYHVPRNVIRMQRRIIRDEGYGVFRTSPSGAQRSTERIAELLESTLTETYLVSAGSPADGATLQGLDLRRRSGGASVIAVVRDGRAETNPSPELELRKGDNLVLVGSHAALESAGRLLRSPGDGDD